MTIKTDVVLFVCDSCGASTEEAVNDRWFRFQVFGRSPKHLCLSCGKGFIDAAKWFGFVGLSGRCEVSSIELAGMPEDLGIIRVTDIEIGWRNPGMTINDLEPYYIGDGD